MKRVLFLFKLTCITLGKLCRQRLLLAGVTLLCFCLPFFLGTAAQEALSGGVDFGGLSLAVAAPEGDPVPAQMESLLGQMRDISQYCSISAMEYEDALESLEAGEVSAVLVLPESFVTGVMDGTNPDISLIVDPERPLEGLLTLWVGQSASDMLAAVQAGVYGVLDLYRQYPSEALSYQDVLVQINLRYINWTLGRQDLFQARQVSAVQGMTIARHYSLSVVCFLVLAMSAFFLPVYENRWLAAQRRLRAAGRGWMSGFCATLSSCTLVVTAVLTAALGFLAESTPAELLMRAAICGLFCASFATLCCLLTDREGSCGMLSFGLALVLLALSGGILPPAMMPQSLRPWMEWSAISWMRSVMAFSEKSAMVKLLIAAALLLLPSMVLYRHRSGKEVTES